MLKYRDLHEEGYINGARCWPDSFAAFMQIYGLERRNEKCICGALGTLMAYCAFTVHGIFSIGLESSFRYDSDQLHVQVLSL